MYCKDCKFWDMKHEYTNGGYCMNESIREDTGKEFCENELVYSYEEGGFFWTGAKFGCVNFKEKSND